MSRSIHGASIMVHNDSTGLSVQHEYILYMTLKQTKKSCFNIVLLTGGGEGYELFISYIGRRFNTTE